MIRFASRSMLAALLAATVFASSASAACAWVLWIDTARSAVTREEARTRVSKWTAHSAAYTKEACEKQRAAIP